MRLNFLTIIISMVVSVAIVSVIIGQFQLGVLAGLLVGLGGAKWIRLKKQEANDEIEYDERVNENIKQYSLQAFAISNLFLLVYLLISNQILKKDMINISYLVLYLSTTFILAFYIVPLIARKK